VLIAGPPPHGPARGVRTAGTTPGSAKPTAATWAVGVAASRPGRERKRPRLKGGQVRKGGAWLPIWGRTAARPFSCRTSPACCPMAGRPRACVRP